MKQHHDTDLVIVGGGMVGLTLACALRHSGLHITVIERAEPQVRYSLARDCRVSAIVLGNVHILQGLGVWQHLEKDVGAMRRMQIWDDQDFGSIRFEAEEIGEDALGYLVENSRLQAALLKEAMASEHIEYCCPASIASVDWQDDGVEVRLDDGQIWRTPLIVGADGAHSWLREQADIGIYSRDYGQKGIVATVRTQLPHRDGAYQRFMKTGPLAFLPMSEGLCSIVWTNDNAEADQLMQLDDAGFVEALNLALGPVLGRIEEVGERAAFPLKARMAMHLVRPRLALIGDAAHTIHPLAGLGVNLGLRDAMVLAQEVNDAKRFREDWGDISVLNRYMKQRLPDILSVMGSMEGLHQTFTTDLPGLSWLRGKGMRAIGNAGIIKQLLMQNSTGLSLPVPKQIG